MKKHHLFKHGKVDTPEYRSWNMMIQRCTNPARDAYRYYGAKGVKVCARWMASFSDFLDDVGPRPSPRHSIDRHPNREGNYEPGNVRWATPREQANNRSNGRVVIYRGQEMTLTAAWRLAGEVVSSDLAFKRLDYGWPVHDAVELPVGARTRWIR